MVVWKHLNSLNRCSGVCTFLDDVKATVVVWQHRNGDDLSTARLPMDFK